jgi:hypothetical protein
VLKRVIRSTRSHCVSAARPTPRYPYAATVALIAALAVMIAGCSSSSGKPKGASSSPPSATLSSSLNTSPTSPAAAATSPSANPSDAATEEATAFVPTYLAMIDKLYSDPTVSINDIYEVAVAPESTTEAVAIAQFRGASDRQAGAQKLIQVSDPLVTLSGLGGTSSTATYPTVQLTACVDVSAITATDAVGKSLVPPSRPNYLLDSLTIVNIKYPSSDSWRVSYATNKQTSSCSG